MPGVKLPDSMFIEALNLVEEYGSAHMAIKAGATDIPRNTLERRVTTARLNGLKPTFRKDAKRIYTRQRIGKTHLVIPDVQAKPGVNTDHCTWIGNYIAEKRPDVIVCIGDFWDFPSLSSYDKGKLDFEGRRYVKDVQAGRDAMNKLLAPFKDIPDYKPEMHFCMGNHEIRVVRVVDLNPEFEGKFDLGDLGLEADGWKVHDFLKVVKIDGIQYSHYFTSGSLGRPVSSAAALLRERQGSATMGHVQQTDIAIHKKTQNIALFCGIAYTHDERYLGNQGNDVRRQIVVKHEVNGEGHYDPMFVSLEFLRKAYS